MQPQQWERVKETFAQVVEQPADERGRLLDELCADDPAIRREVESLLAAHDDSEHLIDADAYGIAAALRAGPGAYAGRHFGQYRILREIGRGGMGAVFLAERADGEFQRQVALKIGRRSLADPAAERRFRGERQILATLSHPHIAHLLDGGVSADGEPFFVMEHVDGARIDEYCAQRQLATRERIALFLKVCEAVAYAHDRSIIHRDLKPSNILVTADGVPKLLDFGIAKLLDPAASGERTLTSQRAFTPDYAAPEQVAGDQPLTTATDVYSLGLLLGTLLDTSASQNRELQNIIAMAQRPEPSRRYQSARELGLDLERFLDGRPVVAQPDSLRYRAAKFVERRKLLLASSASVVGALLVGIVVATLYATFGGGTRPAPLEVGGAMAAPRGNPLANVRTIAVLPLKSLAAASPGPAGEATADHDADQALRVGMADSIVTKLSQVRQLAVRPTSATVRYLDQDYEAAAVGRELQVDSVLEGTLQRAGDELRTILQLVDVASGRVVWADSVTSDIANVLRGQESLANRVSQLLALSLSGAATGDPGGPSGSVNLEAQEAYLRGALALATSVRQVSNIFAARDHYEQALRLDPDFAPALAGLATAYTLAGSLTLLAPQEAYPKAERAARRALELDSESAAAHVALAEIEADYNWNWEAAEANNRRALDLAPNLAAAHQSYAELLARVGRFAEAAAHSDLAQELDPTRINYAAVRALHLYFEHRFTDAISQGERVIARDANAYLAHLYLSVAHAAQGNYAAGLAAGRRASALTGGAVPDFFVLACNHALLNDRPTTTSLLRRLRAMERKRYVDPFHFVAIHAYLGEPERAFEHLETSYARRSYWMTTIKVHPVVDSLRGDPRFAAMLRRMKLE